MFRLRLIFASRSSILAQHDRIGGKSRFPSASSGQALAAPSARFGMTRRWVQSRPTSAPSNSQAAIPAPTRSIPQWHAVPLR